MSVTADLSGLRAVEKMRGDILEEATMRAEFEMRRYVPMDEGVLRASGQLASQFRAGLLIWATPLRRQPVLPVPRPHHGRHHRPLGRGVGARQAAAVDGLRGGHLRREDAMSARIDAVDVARGVLESALGKPVSLSMADSYRRPEATVLTCGMPVPGKRYWDGSGTTSLRLTVIVKRVNEEEAIARRRRRLARHEQERGAGVARRLLPPRVELRRDPPPAPMGRAGALGVGLRRDNRVRREVTTWI